MQRGQGERLGAQDLFSQKGLRVHKRQRRDTPRGGAARPYIAISTGATGTGIIGADGSTALSTRPPRHPENPTSWKTAYRSFYYAQAPEPEDLVLDPAETALLCIDVQNLYLEIPSDSQEAARWFPFHRRMREIVIPTTRGLQDAFRAKGMDVIHARIACLLEDGRDRSLSQKKPGWNALLLPKDSAASQLVPELAPLPGEIVVTKTTDSALTGTNLRLILTNLGIRNVVLTGIFTDQCVSSTVRSLADESFNVIVVEDGCAAGTDELHRRELEILNMIYCQVLGSVELRELMGL